MERFFDSEQSWPFLLRLEQLDDCLSFIQNAKNRPRVLRISGPSGCGKSFFARELLVKLAEKDDLFAAIYTDFPASDLDCFDTIGKISSILESVTTPNRTNPNLVSKKAQKAWQKSKKIGTSSTAKYSYGVLRDLVAQIPAAGPFVKAFMPTGLPNKIIAASPKRGDIDGFKFLLSQAKKHTVCIALDNVQFIPSTLIELIENEFSEVYKGLIFLCIERSIANESTVFSNKISNFDKKEIRFETVKENELLEIVNHIFPGDNSAEKIAKAVHRRSEGNLKSAWFQLKLLADRRQNQELLKYNESYENVIQSLSPVDTTVLRLVVFLLGGLSLTHVAQLFETSILGLPNESVTASISDLTALGLLIVNSEFRDKVKVDHEIVATVVSSLTPEEEKLELRMQLVGALTELLFSANPNQSNDVLYDRLLGIVSENEVKSSPAMLSIVVDFLNKQEGLERYEYICSLFKDTVCWELLDDLPNSSIKTLLNSVQKCSFFSLGLLATQRLKKSKSHESLASIYQAKFLVQLFRYEEASCVLKDLSDSTEKKSILFNISLNLCNDEEARHISDSVFLKSKTNTLTEFEYVILRNSAHLYSERIAEQVVNASVAGFMKLGQTFSVATAINNLGIVKLAENNLEEALKCFTAAEQTFSELDSNEAYQPKVNAAALDALAGDFDIAYLKIVEAKELVSNQLSMDSVMLDYNSLVLDIFLDKVIFENAIPTLRALCIRAYQTKDIRFAEVLNCFYGTLCEIEGSKSELPYDQDYIDRIRSSGLVGIEVFIDKRVRENLVSFPFILSPHWRH